ncbi:MAG: haloacid dehalogenase-like hydrolase [Verrucomicrobia bacterium]|nr:haloacid dehalogenase-like hydrolase [Verrucomicrobiota bacterium]
MTLILLDIDGTLVDSLDLENKYFPQSVCEGLGLAKIKTNWDSFTNPTDSGIVREIMREELGKLCHPEDVERCRSKFIELLTGHIERDPRAFKPIPGALEFIDYLQNHEHYQFAVATAGWRFTAELKLAVAGFDYDDWILYSCCDYEYKKEAMKAAHMEARQKYGSDFDRVLCIGDSRSDLRFSNELGFEFLGRGELYSESNVWGVEGIKDFTDLRLVEGKIHRATQVP